MNRVEKENMLLSLRLSNLSVETQKTRMINRKFGSIVHIDLPVRNVSKPYDGTCTESYIISTDSMESVLFLTNEDKIFQDSWAQE